jgi:hypothetical protein
LFCTTTLTVPDTGGGKSAAAAVDAIFHHGGHAEAARQSWSQALTIFDDLDDRKPPKYTIV